MGDLAGPRAHNNSSTRLITAPSNPAVSNHAIDQVDISKVAAEMDKAEVADPLPDGARIKLRSWKGDYLHRLDADRGVTSWSCDNCNGIQWTVERHGTEVMLKSWKGDYLHRPDSASGVTSYDCGQCWGDMWTYEEATPGSGTIRLKS